MGAAETAEAASDKRMKRKAEGDPSDEMEGLLDEFTCGIVSQGR